MTSHSTTRSETFNPARKHQRSSGRLLLLAFAICLSTLDHSEASEPRVSNQTARREEPKALAKDLMLYYSFDQDRDGKVFDDSDHGAGGATVGRVTYEPSFRGRAVRISGPRTYVQCDASGVNMHGWKQATLSVWIMPRRVTTYGRVVTCGDVAGETHSGLGLRIGGGTKACWSLTRQYRSNNPSAERLFTSAVEPSRMLGRWSHLVGTFDGKYMRLYHDAREVQNIEVASKNLHIWGRPDHKLIVGTAATRSRMAWSDKYFDGLVDELRIWKRSLSAEEVELLHARDRRAAQEFSSRAERDTPSSEE